MQKNWRSVMLVLMIYVFVNHMVTLALDLNPESKTKKSSYREAAVAIRDDVPEWQKFATRCFSVAQLKRRYATVFYQAEKDTAIQRKVFITNLHTAATLNDSVDVFLLMHSNNVISWLMEIPRHIRAKIRLVYNAGCGDFRQGAAWKSAGVKYYLAHKGAYSWSPVFYFSFMKRWVKNQSLQACIVKANHYTRFLLWLAGQSSAKRNESCAGIYTP